MQNDARNRPGHRIGPGASTVLMILLVLCLTMLGALSLAAARNDLAITRRALVAERAYHSAQAEAAAQLAGLDARIADLRASSGDEAAFRSALEALEGYDAATGEIDLRLPVDDHRTLWLTLRVLPLDAARPFETIRNQIEIIPEEMDFDSEF